MKNEGCSWFTERLLRQMTRNFGNGISKILCLSRGNRISYGDTSYAKDKYSDTPIEKYKVKQDEVAKWFDGATMP